MAIFHKITIPGAVRLFLPWAGRIPLLVLLGTGCAVLRGGTPELTPGDVTEQGFRFLKEEQWSFAMGAFRNAIDLDPGYAPARYGLGRVFTATGYLDGAQREYLQSIAIDPAYGQAYLGLGDLYYGLGRYDEAEENIDRAVRYGAGDTFEAQFLLGLFAEMRNDPEEAEMCFRNALLLEPENTRARLALVDLLRGGGRWADALAELERERFPIGKEEEVRERLVDCHFHLGQDLAAERIYRMQAGRDETDPEPRLGLVLLALRRGDTETVRMQLLNLADLLDTNDRRQVISLADALDFPDPFFILLSRCRKVRPFVSEEVVGWIDRMIHELVQGAG